MAILPPEGRRRVCRGSFVVEAARLRFRVATREGVSIEFDGIINDDDLELRAVEEANGAGSVEVYKFYPGTTSA